MKNNINDKIKSAGDELLMNIPHLTVTGHSEVYIENHNGIEVYNPELVRVSVKGGSIGVRGTELNIDSVRVSDIFISGNISEIEFEF